MFYFFKSFFKQVNENTESIGRALSNRCLSCHQVLDFELLARSFHQVFLKFVPDDKKLFEEDNLDFEGKFILYPKCSEIGHF